MRIFEQAEFTHLRSLKLDLCFAPWLPTVRSLGAAFAKMRVLGELRIAFSVLNDEDDEDAGIFENLDTVTWMFPVLRSLALTTVAPYFERSAQTEDTGLPNWPQINAPALERLELFSRCQFSRVVALVCSLPLLG